MTLCALDLSFLRTTFDVPHVLYGRSFVQLATVLPLVPRSTTRGCRLTFCHTSASAVFAKIYYFIDACGRGQTVPGWAPACRSRDATAPCSRSRWW